LLRTRQPVTERSPTAKSITKGIKTFALMKLDQFISIFVYSLIALWHLAPRLRKAGRAEALIALLWVHVFRYSVLYLFTAQREGYAISDFSATEIVAGDLAGAVTALVAIFLLRRQMSLGFAFSWLVIAETIVDTAIIFHQRTIDPPRADATGVWWVVFVFFAPMVIVSLPLLAWQLYARRNEPLTRTTAGAVATEHSPATIPI
jgi:hypothetical protein